MKRCAFKHISAKTAKRFTSALLITCTVLFLSMPAFAENGNTAEPSALLTSRAVVLSQVDMPGDGLPSGPPQENDETAVQDSEEHPNSSENNGLTEEPAFSEAEAPQEPAAKTFIITYNMGALGTQTEIVEEGNYPRDIPTPELPAAEFLGWYDPYGGPADPANSAVYENRTYTARFGRHLADLLDTGNHNAYINGYSNGMFKSEAGITRAETAAIFYKLLRSKDWDRKTFLDVKPDKWYYNAIGAISALGIVSGYQDGKFLPDKTITRAEFIKMAVSFDTLEDGAGSFSDVKDSHWAKPYIITAVSKGWIDGYSDGTFRPDAKIKRSEAVVIVNRMLGRYVHEGIGQKKDVKNFYDLFTSHWAYGQIVEASTTHQCTVDHETKTEVWQSYEPDTAPVKSKWVTDGDDLYYLDANTRKFVRGVFKVNGQEYVFDSVNGKAFTGFRYAGQWKRYYKKGLVVNDISNLGVVRGPYYIKVYKKANYLIIYAKDGQNGYTIPVKAMITSCGYSTPTGTYYTPSRYRWLRMEGFTWAQWCTQISGNYLFHSVPNWTQSNLDLEVHEYNRLGETRSMGCIRLKCVDAKWIYDNCSLGTQVFISGTETSGPLSKPGSIQLPSWHTWDPTDPTAYYMCRRKGCH